MTHGRSVLLVTQDLERAGAQRQCVELALGLAARGGWHVEVVALEPSGPLAEELRGAGIPLHVEPRRWRWDLSPAWAVASLVKRNRYDVVHTFMFLPNFYGRLARMVARPPALVSSLRSAVEPGWSRRLLDVLMAPLCDRVIANSEVGRGSLTSWGVSARRVVVVRNGLDLSRFRPNRGPGRVTGRCRRIGMVARLDPQKDHVGLISAFATVRERMPDTRLILVGDGALRGQIEDLVQATPVLRGAVELCASRGRVEEIYPTLDIYVLASRWPEGMNNTIIEAMACGCPVVATDSGGNREIVEDGKTGLIVPPHDPKRLAAALLSLLADPARAHGMGQAGQEAAQTCFGRQTMVEATIGVYDSILAERNRP